MNGLLKTVTCSGIVAFAGMTVAEVSAATHGFTASWSSGIAVGQVAGWCNYIVPDERPLTVPRTFVVGNDVPNGTEIFSWGYGEAFSDFIASCTSSGIGGGGGDIDGYLDSRILINSDSGGYIPLSDSGFGLKLWLRFNTAPGFNYTGCGGVSVYCEYYDTSYSYPSYTSKVPAGTEIDGTLAGYSSQGATQTIRKYRNVFSPVNYIFPTYTGSISVRMSLVKIGTIQYNGPLAAKSPAFALRNTIRQNSSTSTLTGFLDGSGITIAPPACQLKTTDYTLPMGRWAADVINYTGAPAYGAQVPVNLSLECSGKVNHVRFRFEDTGTSLSSNKNISLYDTAGGSKIEGLEIEMLYNGSKVNVDNTTITDTGSHGAFVSLTPAFDSFGTAAFHARYVQNAAVTRSGANYTGPVTGKVNMYVTYD